MNIILEEKDSLVSVMPILYQFDKNDKFHRAVLGLKENEFVIYDDQEPDVKSDQEVTYKVKKRFPLDRVHTIINEIILHSDDLFYANRLNVITADLTDSFFLYYFKDDRKYVKVFIKCLENRGVEIQRKKVDLRSTVE